MSGRIQGAGDGEQKDGAFYYAPFCSNGNKTQPVLFCCCSFTLEGYEVTSVLESLLIHLKGFSALSSEIEINKCPCDCFRI